MVERLEFQIVKVVWFLYSRVVWPLYAFMNGDEQDSDLVWRETLGAGA